VKLEDRLIISEYILEPRVVIMQTRSGCEPFAPVQSSAPTVVTAGTSYYKFSPHYHRESVDASVCLQTRIFFRNIHQYC
jgi:hypothetical protein